jgi:hypothetical protein
MKTKLIYSAFNISTATIISLISFLVINQYFNSQKAGAEEFVNSWVSTKWGTTDASLTRLLNSGWQISGHSFSHAVTAPAPGVGGSNERSFTFMLTKDSKYMICIVSNPNPPTANRSVCRSLN